MNNDHYTWPIGKTIYLYLEQIDSEDNPFSVHEIIVLKDTASNDYRCFEVVAECCSQTWVEHISGISSLSSRVTSILFSPEPIEMCANDRDYPCTHKRMYVYKIVTEIGVCDIELRNISNGAYHGKILPWTKHFRLWSSMTPIKEDF